MLWRNALLACLLTFSVASPASSSIFVAGFVEDVEGVRIPDATIVLHQAGIKLDDLRASESGWFESRDLSLELESGSEIRIAVIKEGFELWQISVTIKETENFVVAVLVRLEGILAFSPEHYQAFALHGYLGDERGSGPVAGARVALRVGREQVSLAYSRESGYFSLPVAVEYLGREGDLIIDHISYGAKSIKTTLAKDSSLMSVDLRPADGYLHFISYPEVLKLPFAQLKSANIIFGRTFGYSHVSAEINGTSVNAIIEPNAWQMRLGPLNIKEARSLVFEFNTSFRNLPREARERVLRQLGDDLPRILEASDGVSALRTIIDEVIHREVDGFLGQLDKAMDEELRGHGVSTELRDALQALNAEVVDNAEIMVLERGVAWRISPGYLVFSNRDGLLVYLDPGKEYLPYTRLSDDLGNTNRLENLMQAMVAHNHLEPYLVDLDVAQRVARLPPDPLRERWSLGPLLSHFSPRESIPGPEFGYVVVANFSLFPFVRLRNPLEEVDLRLTDWRSNVAITAGVGWGTFGQIVDTGLGPSRPLVASDDPAAGNGGKAIYVSDICLSLGLGYRFDELLLSAGLARVAKFSGYYVGFGLSFPIKHRAFRKRESTPAASP